MGEFGEITAVLLERSEGVLRILGGDALPAADVCQNTEHGVFGCSEAPEQIPDRTVG